MLFSFALCLSTLIVGADRTILMDGNISQIKLFNLPNSSSISSVFMCGASLSISDELATELATEIATELAKHAVSKGTKAVTKYTSELIM